MTKEKFIEAYEQAVPNALHSRNVLRKTFEGAPKAAKLKGYGTGDEAEKKVVESNFEKAFKNWHSKTSDDLILKSDVCGWQNIFGDLGLKFGIAPVEKIAPQLEECQKGLAEKVKRQTFGSDTIVRLSNDSIKALLAIVDTADLAKAFKIMNNATKNKILCNMEKRAAAMLEEDVEFMGPIIREAAEESATKISDAVFKLYQESKIKFVKK